MPVGPRLSTTPIGVVAESFGWTYRSRTEPALAGLTFTIEPGQVLLVLGPSGSGKSTLARALAGIVPHSMQGEWRGRLVVDGSDVPATSPSRIGAQVGIVFQDPDSQLVMPKVEDEVAFGLENRGWPRPAMHARVPLILGEVGLPGFEHRLSQTLSGGEKQRLALADILAAGPRLIVFDEPTANLDPPGMVALFERLGRLAAGRRHTLVIVEHRLDAALPLADLVLLLDGSGRQMAFGAPDEIGPRFAAQLDRLGGWIPSAWRSDARSSATPVSSTEAERPKSGPAGAGEDGRRPGWGSLGSPTLAPRDGRPAPERPVGNAARLAASDVSVSYPGGRPGERRHALSRVSIELGAGERVALVGPNGSGKSTLLFVLAGIRKPDLGTVRVGDGSRPPDRDPGRLRSPDLATLLGLVLQDPELGFVGRTVLLEATAGRWSGAPERAALATVGRQTLVRFGLEQLAGADPFRISQGEQRRLSLASVAARSPAVLLLDEPTFGLDRIGSDRVVALLDEGRTNGQAQLLATHDPRLLPACDRVVALDSGRVVFDGPAATFLASPPFEPSGPWMAPNERGGTASGREATGGLESSGRANRPAEVAAGAVTPDPGAVASDQIPPAPARVGPNR